MSTPLTHDDMVAIIESGTPVIWQGEIIYDVDDLPTQEEIDAAYVTNEGPQGPQGVPGDPGDNGTNGVDGDSAYQVAVNNGFVGDEAAWLASLVGDTGPQGPQGDPGLDGTGSGNMNGPASSVDENIPIFDGTGGELLKDSGVALTNLATTSDLSTGLAGKENSLGFTAVPNTRTVNGHALSADVTVS